MSGSQEKDFKDGSALLQHAVVTPRGCTCRGEHSWHLLLVLPLLGAQQPSQGALLGSGEPAHVLTVRQACSFGCCCKGKGGCIAAPLPHRLRPWAALGQSGATAHPSAAALLSQVPQRSSSCATKCTHRCKAFPLNSWLSL